MNSAAVALIFAALFSVSSCRKADQANLPTTTNQAGSTSANAVQRPFSDYLNAQGSTSINVSPVPDFIAWGDPIGARPNYYDFLRWVSIDYNGTSAAYLASHGGPVINTRVSGSVTEMQMADGRAKVTVKVHTENALTFAFTVTLNTFLTDPQYALHAALDFGYRANDLLANTALTPALGSSDISITFFNPAPGASIPDLLELFGPRYTDIVSISVLTSSSGSFHATSGFTEGAQGVVKSNQKGIVFVGFKDNRPVFVPQGTTNDGFAVETVTYQLR